MTLHLMRHAEALDIGTDGIAHDEDRKLSDKGRRQARRMGVLLKRLHVKIDTVLASPALRARETAEIVLRAMSADAQIRLADSLQPTGHSREMWEDIRRTGGEKILVVGHLPSLATLADALLGISRENAIWFHKSTLATLQCELSPHQKPHARLELLISPAMTRHLAQVESSDGRR
jgi:phosphohistidine phosphatase